MKVITTFICLFSYTAAVFSIIILGYVTVQFYVKKRMNRERYYKLLVAYSIIMLLSFITILLCFLVMGGELLTNTP